jgi:ABC-type proline/glycine betaine transport system substrate-binding protein
MNSLSRLMACVALLAPAACASIGSGTTQTIAVNTNPPGAQCGLFREGFRIATVQTTPGTATVDKTKHDIAIICVLAGHDQAQYYNRSQAEAMTFGNLIIGGGIGWAIDSASGADNKYDSPVNINLVPLAPGSNALGGELPASIQFTTREAARAEAARNNVPRSAGTGQ